MTDVQADELDCLLILSLQSSRDCVNAPYFAPLLSSRVCEGIIHGHDLRMFCVNADMRFYFALIRCEHRKANRIILSALNKSRLITNFSANAHVPV
jgi:hypothetical protein